MGRGHGPLVLGAALVLVGLTGCAENGGDDPPAAGGESRPAEVALERYPDTTASAVFAYLQQQRYRENWQHWPGREPFYRSGDPHGTLLATWVNSAGMDGLATGASTMPPHTMIVKENFERDSSLVALTIMYKVPGYDPGQGGWWWAKLDGTGAPEVAGRAPLCAQCHGSRADNDYIMTSDLPLPEGAATPRPAPPDTTNPAGIRVPDEAPILPPDPRPDVD